MSRAAIESEPSWSTGRQQPCWERLCLDPTQSSSVLSVLSLSWFADIEWPTSAMHHSSRAAADVVSVRRQWRYTCVSSANVNERRTVLLTNRPSVTEFAGYWSSCLGRSAIACRACIIAACLQSGAHLKVLLSLTASIFCCVQEMTLSFSDIL